uniref:Uncharacterized protein n=1 Tax=Arundo donax TaxID=35708 RepID=A0A0A8ZAC5_ARUDO
MLAKAYLRLSMFHFFDTTMLNFTKIRSTTCPKSLESN